MKLCELVKEEVIRKEAKKVAIIETLKNRNQGERQWRR